jgi:CDP-diglyceride synthetase
MFTKRMLTVIILVPILVLVIALGGWALTLFLTVLMAIAGWEFWRLFKT